MKNPWNKLSSTFDTKKDEGAIEPDAADNIFIAWPVVLDFIKKYKFKEEGLRVLEYGCGGGGFANKLAVLGYQVTGVDSSEAMVQVAKRAYGSHAKFLFGNSSLLSTLPAFQIITSIMTLQFIEDVEQTLRDLSQALKPGGILVFAVHNPAHVRDYLKAKTLFEDFDSEEKPKKGFINLMSNKIPIFIRIAMQYNSILKNMEFEPLLEAYPPFTEEFLLKYPTPVVSDNPRFLVLGYKKR